MASDNKYFILSLKITLLKGLVNFGCRAQAHWLISCSPVMIIEGRNKDQALVCGSPMEFKKRDWNEPKESSDYFGHKSLLSVPGDLFLAAWGRSILLWL